MGNKSILVFKKLKFTIITTWKIIHINVYYVKDEKVPGQIFRTHGLGEIHGRVQEFHHLTSMKITKLVPLPILSLWANSIYLLLEDSFVPTLHQQLEWEKFESMVLLLGLLIFILKIIKQDILRFLWGFNKKNLKIRLSKRRNNVLIKDENLTCSSWWKEYSNYGVYRKIDCTAVFFSTI